MGETVLHPAQIVLSFLLFFILFFGIGFILNMLLRTTWFPGLIVYPLVVLIIVSDVSFWSYFTQPLQSFAHLGNQLISLKIVDYLILSAGLGGAILSGITIKVLRKKGYRMF